MWGSPVHWTPHAVILLTNWVAWFSGRALAAYARVPGFNSQRHHLSFPLPFQRSSDSISPDCLQLDHPNWFSDCGGVPCVVFCSLSFMFNFYLDQLQMATGHTKTTCGNIHVTEIKKNKCTLVKGQFLHLLQHALLDFPFNTSAFTDN